MGIIGNLSKRVAHAGGALSSLTATTAAAATVAKAPGETKIVALFNTSARYNAVAQEIALRNLFGAKRRWRIIAVRSNRLFAPELIGDADLLVSCGSGAEEPLDLFSGETGIADAVGRGTPLWTDRNLDAVMENVTKRGMGFIALNDTVQAGNARLLEFLDVAALPAKETQPLWVTRINKEHPVTEGVGKFLVLHDDQHGIIIKSGNTVTLFETTAVHEKRQTVSGWALDRGAGRIVGILPGCTTHAYSAPEYRNILWRAAHWAMNRAIEPYPEAENTLYN